MWEQQIARVKRNPVKSPLEPVEIVLDDGEAETTAVTVHPPQPSPRHRNQCHLLQQQQQHLRQVTPLCSFKINNNNIALNNNSNNINNNNNTINNNNTNISVHSGNNNSRAANNNYHDFEGNNNNNNAENSLAVFQAKYLPLARSRMSTASASYVPSSEGSFRQEDSSNGDPSSAWPSPVLPRPPSRRDSSPSFIRGSQSAGGSGVEQREGLRRGGEDGPVPASDWPLPPSEDNKSMLKSLLLDRMKRKLSSGPATANQEDGGGNKKAAYSPSPLQPPPSPVQAAAAARLVSPVPEALPASGPQDILRKRLLGWVDPPAPITPQSDQATEQSRSRSQQSATATTANTVQQQVADAVQQEGGDPRSGGEMVWSDLPSSQPTQHLSDRENKMAPLDHHHVDKSGDSHLNHLETGSKISVSYAHTSVLKHLLYRYTSMGQ
jgi:hypothetical protein